MTNHEIIKNETRELHSLLEELECYSALLRSNTEQHKFSIVLENFKLVFGPLFIKNKMDTYYQQFYRFLNYENDITSYLQKSSLHYESLYFLALEYVFLGSRFGVSHIVKVNPTLLESNFKEYFQIPVDGKRWKKCLDKINMLDENGFSKLFIYIETTFKGLILLGLKSQ